MWYELLIDLAPYALIVLNAVISVLTYRRTGKVTYTYKSMTGEDIVNEDLQKLIDYHEKVANELKNKLK